MQNIEINKVVRLEPPKLNSSTILKKVICMRPMREGRFHIAADHQGHKDIIHCYGMGGSGWTTLFGSVNKAIRLFRKKADKKKPIRVIGAGCMGLTAAIELSRLGFKVTGITAKELYGIPSWRAGGYFAFVSLQTAPEAEADLEKIGIETFRSFEKIHRGEHPYIQPSAVRYLPVYGTKKIDLGLEPIARKGLIPPGEEVTIDFGSVQHDGYMKYMTYFLETTDIMKQLTAETIRLSIPIEKREIGGFDEVEEEVIFNCSGLGGRELNRDSSLIPVRGHLLLFNEASGDAHMDYLIYTSVEQAGKQEYIYLFPKTMAVSSDFPQGIPCQGVLGGTFIPHVEGDSELLDEEEFKKMVDRTSLFFYGKNQFF